MLNFIKIVLYVLLRFLYPTSFKGKKNIPKGRAVFICNHTSNIDVILVELSSWKKKYYLGKKELFKNKFVGGFLKSINTIPIDRNKADINAIKQSLKVLKNEKALVIFPEGTRNKTDKELSSIKAGAAMFAIKSKSPIVPIWIKKRPKLFRFNTLRYGEPFTLNEFYDKKLDSETLSKAGEIITKKLLENKI